MAIAKATTPSKEMARKALPPNELSLEEQAIAKATAAWIEEEVFTVKRRAI